ncbi:hypothetical protein [Streptomyces sp. VRA16 Mangrove soil]|uniref:hypothetical protein n=1 Tax=Streptomyces sp. VRA16 Mangrove soil TaxID=2817434 RepID=UPI001A9D37CC|nr:hypothetical protein [Streptomyces sp. VRA16 Mangrove soil]MBO1334679.1 hypothetical protein [Streptomyces sp. VRA16 Mangrove soil]
MAYLRSFLPWIAVSALIGSIDIRYALLAGFALAVVLAAGQRRAGRAWDALVIEVSAGAYFAVATAAAFAAPGSDTVAHYASAGASLWLALVAWGSIVIGRPFTLGIAKTQVPEELWGNPVFKRVNVVISAVWAASFTVSGIGTAWLRHARPEDGTARTVLTVVCLVLPILFTVRYPEIARSRAATAAAAARNGADK